MTAEITPEQRETLARDLFLARGWCEEEWICTGPELPSRTAGRQRAREDVDIFLALGWRTPGPPTDAEVERAARAITPPGMGSSDWTVRLVRAALTAALTREGENG